MRIEERLTNEEFNKALGDFVLKKAGIQRLVAADVHVDLMFNDPGYSVGPKTKCVQAIVVVEFK
jgi:hypothetical protein